MLAMYAIAIIRFFYHTQFPLYKNSFAFALFFHFQINFNDGATYERALAIAVATTKTTALIIIPTIKATTKLATTYNSHTTNVRVMETHLLKYRMKYIV